MRQAGRDVICNRFKVPARLFVGHFRALRFGNEYGPDDRLFAHKFTSPGSARLAQRANVLYEKLSKGPLD